MELMQLRFFCKAASTGSFARAAEHFQVPPSSISHCIRRLEQELGAPLFERTPNRVTLNAHGQLFYQGIQQALDAIDQSTERFSRDTNYRLKIGYSQGRDILEKTLLEYTAQSAGSNATIQKLSWNTHSTDFDIIVSAENAVLTDHTIEYIHREPLVLCAAKNALPEISPITLQNCSFIASSPNGNIYKNIQKVCQSIGFVPKVSLELQMTNLILRYVSCGMGITILPYQSWALSMHRYPLDCWVMDGFCRETYVYCRKKRHPHEGVETFLRLLLDNFRQQLEQTPNFPHLSL